MQYVGTWLTEIDRAILEFYQDHDIAVPPKVVQVNAETDALYNSVARRFRALERAGALEKLDDPSGYYRVTDKGLRIATGEMDRDELTAIKPEPE